MKAQQFIEMHTSKGHKNNDHIEKTEKPSTPLKRAI